MTVRKQRRVETIIVYGTYLINHYSLRYVPHNFKYELLHLVSEFKSLDIPYLLLVNDGNYNDGNYNDGNYNDGNYNDGNYNDGNYYIHGDSNVLNFGCVHQDGCATPLEHSEV
jgi:hypothetical protein